MERPKWLKNMFFLVPAALVSTSACQSQSNHPTESQVEVQSQEIMETQTLYQEITRLALTYPQDSLVAKTYLGRSSEINPIFKPLRIGLSPDWVYDSSTRTGEPNYTPEKRFGYLLHADKSLVQYETLQGLTAEIYFSPSWMKIQSDEVKKLMMEKEAITLGLWEGFAKIILNTYRMQGEISLLDKNTTETEIANTLARQITIDNPELLKVYAGASYLALLPQVKNLLALNDPRIIEDLKPSHFLELYHQAQTANTQFENMQPWSNQFWELAFNPNSPWVKILLRKTNAPAL